MSPCQNHVQVEKQTLQDVVLIFRYRRCSVKKFWKCLAMPSALKLTSGIPHSAVILVANSVGCCFVSGLLNLGKLSPHLCVAYSPIFFLLYTYIVKVFETLKRKGSRLRETEWNGGCNNLSRTSARTQKLEIKGFRKNFLPFRISTVIFTFPHWY